MAQRGGRGAQLFKALREKERLQKQRQQEEEEEAKKGNLQQLLYFLQLLTIFNFQKMRHPHRVENPRNLLQGLQWAEQGY